MEAGGHDRLFLSGLFASERKFRIIKTNRISRAAKILAFEKWRFQKSFIDDIKSLLRVLIMFLPVPMFWALYDQQGSIWLIQGIQMDCRLSSNVLLLPDQVQTLNAVLILLFIPLFQIVVYPLTAKCFNITPLRKMVVGGFLASLSFLVTGFVQLSVNQTLPPLPSSNEAYVSIWNQLDNCSVVATFPGLNPYTVAANTVRHGH
ncbi:hypothetical protein COOONC_14128 [Cooperia oncophora]